MKIGKRFYYCFVWFQA